MTQPLSYEEFKAAMIALGHKIEVIDGEERFVGIRLKRKLIPARHNSRTKNKFRRGRKGR